MISLLNSKFDSSDEIIWNSFFESIEQEIVSNVLYSDKLEKQFLLENYRRAGLIPHEITGVSAGDEVEIDSAKEHKLTRNKNSKSLFATRNNTAIDRVIEKTFSIFADKYDQSLEESQFVDV